MDPKRWAEVRRLFEDALESADPERYVHEADVDAEVKSEALALLSEDARERTPLDTPALSHAIEAIEAEELDAVPAVDVSPYKLVEAVGRGGMGAVYRATRADGQIDRAVALKLVHAGLETSEILQRFQEERRILASLEHPNIARLYDVGRSGDGRPFLVMEFVEGRSIREYANDNGLDVADRLRLFLQVCEAVAHAHQGFVIHRDLKPSNILVTEDGTAKLLDFGIAKLIDPDGSAAQTVTGSRMMTSEYASLEQLRGEVLSAASDVYSLGVVLFELLTGDRPIKGWEQAIARAMAPDTATAVPRPSARVTAGEPTTITSPTTGDRLARTLKGDLDEIVVKALRPDPGDRYQDVTALADDLGAYLEGRPVSAQPPSMPYRVGKFVRRRRGAVAAGIVLLATLIGAAGVSTWQARIAAAERDQAVAVTNFLEDLFRSPDPRVGVVEDTTEMVDFLAIAEERVRSGLDGATRARLQLLLGSVYRNLSRPDLAMPVLRASLESHREGGGSSPNEDTVEARRLLGLSLAETGSFDDGLAELQGALEEQVDLEGEGAPNTARLEETIGRAYATAQQNDDAIDWLERAMESRRLQDPAPRADAMSSVLNLLASAYMQDGRPTDAAPLMEEAADLLSDPGNGLDPRLRRADEGYVRNNLSEVLMGLGDREAAEEQAERAWALLDSAFTGNNPAKATNLERRATLLAVRAEGDLGAISRADSMYRASIAMNTALPREPGALMFAWNGYARSLRTWSRLPGGGPYVADAVEAFRTSVSEGERDFGGGHPLVLSARVDLGAMLVEAGRAADGLAETTPAYRGIEAAVPPSHPMSGNAAIAHARALIANGRAAEALEVLARVRGPLAEAISDEHPLVQTMDEMRLRAEEELGR